MHGDVRIHTRHVDVQTIRYRFRDALIRLMWNKQTDIVRLHAGSLQHVARNLSHRTNGTLEQFVASHLEVVIAGRECLGSWLFARAATGREKLLFVTDRKSTRLNSSHV